MNKKTDSNFKKAVNELLGYQYSEEESDEAVQADDPAYEEAEAPVQQEEPMYANESSGRAEYVKPLVKPAMPAAKTESMIAEDMEIAGNLSSKTDLNIFGRVTGNVSCGGSVVLGGNVDGDITALDIVISGSVTGNVTVSGRAMVENGAWVKGDIIAKNVVTDGTTEGDMKAEEIVIFKGSSVVTGNIYTKTFEVNPGAKVKGLIHTYD